RRSPQTQGAKPMYHNNIILFRPSETMVKRVIRIGGAALAEPVDTLRDLLAELAAQRISTASKHVFWQEADGGKIKLTCHRLAAVLAELNVEFQNDSCVPMRPPPPLLSVFLSMAAPLHCFSPCA